ncbi:MAG: hypothetical protein AAF499_02185 [Pseudomonadota bacterium]
MIPEPRTLCAADCDAATSLLAEHFLAGSPLHRAQDLDARAWAERISADVQRAARGECSIVVDAPDGTSLAGCLIGVDASEMYHAAGAEDDASAVAALLAALRARAPAPQPGLCFLIDMAVVAPHHAGAGLYTSMRKAAHERAAAAGYRHARGELSSVATQRICIERFGHRVHAEIHYADFTYQGTRPFAHITEPDAIRLVEGAI